MKKIALITSISLLVVLSLAGVSVLLTMHPWVQLQLVRRVFDILAERSNTRIEITEFRAGLAGDVRFSGLRVSEADGHTMLAVEHGRAAVNLRALMDRSVEIESLILAQFQLNLRQEETLNIADFGESLPARSQLERELVDVESWKLTIAAVDLLDGSLSYSGKQQELPPLSFDGADLQARDLEISRGNVALDVRYLSIEDFNGLSLDHGEFVFSYSEYEIRLEHLWLSSGNSSLRAALSLATAQAGLPPRKPELIAGDSLFSATIYDTRFAAVDLERLLPFVPAELSRPFHGADVRVNASVYGTLDELQFPLLDVALDERNRLVARGEVHGLINRDKFAYNVTIDRLESDREQLRRLGVDEQALPLALPQWLSASGTLAGTLSGFSADLSGDSSAGEARFSGELRPAANAADARLGDRLEHTLRARLIFRDDIDVSVDVEINQKADIPTYRGSASVERVNLQVFGLADTALLLSGRTRFDVAFDSPGRFHAAGRLTDLVLRETEREHRLERLTLLAYSRPQASGHESLLEIDSDVLTMEFSSDLPFSALGDDLQQHVERYFALPGSRTPERPGGNIDMRVDLREPLSLLVPLVPELSVLSTLSARMTYDGAAGSLTAEAYADEVAFSGYRAEQLSIQVSTGPSVLRYEVAAARLQVDDLVFHGPVVRGDARGNALSAYLVLDDEHGDDLLRVGVHARLQDEKLALTFDPRRLIVRSQSWDVPEDHLVLISAEAVQVENLRLVKDESIIELDSRSNQDETFPALDIRISDLDLATILALLDGGEEAYSGSVSGSATLFFPTGAQPRVTAEIRADELVLAAREIGNLLFELQYEEGESRFIAELSKDDNLATAEGRYRFAEQQGEAQVELSHLDIEYLSGYIPDEFSRATGHLSGTVAVSGSFVSPDINGTISFHDAGFTVTQLGTSFTIGDEAIQIRRNVVRFIGFSVRDRLGNRVSIDGEVELAPDPLDVLLNLAINADGFTLLDTTARDNPRFYGRLIIDSDLQLAGALAQPQALGSIGLQQGSSVTLVLPDPGAMVGEAEGVVRFRDSQLEEELGDEMTPGQTVFRGVEVSVNLEVDSSTAVDLIVDERSGDRLRLRGGGELSLAIDPTGTLSLSGRYDIAEGSYVLSFYNITRRLFSISSGSSIVWTGDPLDAILDVRASYTVRAAVSPLLAAEAPAEERADVVGELPFQVVLTMQGSLTRPEVDFSLDMPPRERAAMGGAPYAALMRINEQESRRNTQAFSLIVLNQFVADDFGGIDEAAVVAAGARSSASQLLSYQLNALSRRVIPGIDLTFEVESYEEFTEQGPEGRTELGVQVSQRLLDDRLIVRFGGQFDLEGERSRETSFSELAGDLSVEYLLTADGRYRVRGFREQEYEGPLDGTLTTTGFSFVFRHEFDRLPWERTRPRREAVKKREETQDAE